MIAYQMLAGDPPFAGTVPELLTQHREIEPVPLREKRRKIPAGVDAVVGQALAKDKNTRPATAGAFALLLRLHTESYEWIEREADDLCRKHRWKLIGLALRMQWKGWLLSCLSLLAALALPGMSSAKSVAIVGLLWLAILASTIWKQNALTAACTLLLGQTNGETDLRGIAKVLRHRGGDLARASAIEMFSLARFSGFRRMFEKTLIVPALIREQLSVEEASKRSAALTEPIRQKTAFPFFIHLLVYTWIPATSQAVLLAMALQNVQNEGFRKLPVTLPFFWLPTMLAIGFLTLELSLKSAIEQAILYFTARRALGEIPLEPSTLLPRQDAETGLARILEDLRTGLRAHRADDRDSSLQVSDDD